MELIQTYAKEIFSLLIPILTWFLNHIFRAKAKLQLAVPHSFTFIVDEPLKDKDGNIINPKQSVHTASHVLTNAGKETATNIELVFNWKPLCMNVWPSRSYGVRTNADDRYVLHFDSLAPNEQIGIELLSINGELPRMVNARSDQCTALTIQMYPQPVAPAWKRRIAMLLLFFGLAFAVYVIILVLQFLLLGTPYGLR